MGPSAVVRNLALCALLPALAAVPGVLPAGQPPPVLESEVADVATLPPLKSHDLLVSRNQGGILVIDGDTLKTMGSIYTAQNTNFALSPDNKFIYVAESYWSHGNRGQRQDLLSVYAADSLKLLTEIPLPGRLLSDPMGTRNFDLSADGKYAYVYNFQPASSVIIVDLGTRKVTGTVETPGCGQVFPWGERGFASLCSDGSMAVASANAKGKYSVTRVPKFFDVENDPIFDESLVDRRTGKAIFISYTGLIYIAQLGEQPVIGKPWSLQQAAGLSPATTKVGHITWRPAGNVLAAYHRASGRLYVLMHEGPHWNYAQGATEIWVVDLSTQKVLHRFEIPESAARLAVTQDAAPLLFAMSAEYVWALNADSGEVMGTTRVHNSSLVGVKDF